MKSNVANKATKAAVALSALALCAVVSTAPVPGAGTELAQARTRPVSAECTRWAESFGGDLYTIHESGCDDNGDGTYSRVTTPCAAAARRNVRAGYTVGTVEFRIRVANVGQRCVLFEDGSWGAE